MKSSSLSIILVSELAYRREIEISRRLEAFGVVDGFDQSQEKARLLCCALSGADFPLQEFAAFDEFGSAAFASLDSSFPRSLRPKEITSHIAAGHKHLRGIEDQSFPCDFSSWRRQTTIFAISSLGKGGGMAPGSAPNWTSFARIVLSDEYIRL